MMAFPDSLKLITLTGDFRDGGLDGAPREGVVTIALPTPIRSEGDNVIIPPFEVSVDLEEGSFSIDLPATTDPEWLPNTVEYVIQATFTDHWHKLWWALPLPWDTDDDALDLADVGAPNVGTPASTIWQGTMLPLADGGYKGAWASGTLYRTGDTVQHSSSVYGALRASTAVTPGTSPTIWKVYPSSGGGAVDSVNGQTGEVVLDAADVGADVSGAAALAASNAASALSAHASDTTGIHGIADTSVLATLTDLSTGLVGKQNVDSDLTAIAALTPSNDDVVQRKAGVWTNRTPAQIKVDLGLIKADVGLGNVDNTSDATKPISTATQTALDLKAPLANAALTGTTTVVNVTQSGRYLSTPDALAFATTIVIDAAQGNDFTLTLTGPATLGNPSNPSNGQKILFAIRQDGTGNHTLVLDTAYRLGTDIPAVTLSTAANKTDYLGCRYNSADSKWDVIAFVKGY